MIYAERYRGYDRPLSVAEERVFAALRFLPSRYIVRTAERLLYSVPGSDEVATFEPDFEVQGPGGSMLVVEVMGGPSLSLMNLCVLAEVDKLLGQRGRTLLVLVEGVPPAWFGQAMLAPFAALRIKVFGSEQEVADIIQHELALASASSSGSGSSASSSSVPAQAQAQAQAQAKPPSQASGAAKGGFEQGKT